MFRLAATADRLLRALFNHWRVPQVLAEAVWAVYAGEAALADLRPPDVSGIPGALPPGSKEKLAKAQAPISLRLRTSLRRRRRR